MKTYLVTGVISGNEGSCLRTLAKVAFRLFPLKGVVANWIWRDHQSTGSLLPPDIRTNNHLVDKNTESPPVDGRSMTTSLDDFWSDVLFSPNK